MVILSFYPRQQRFIVHLLTGAAPAGDDQNVQRWVVFNRLAGFDLEAVTRRRAEMTAAVSATVTASKSRVSSS